MDDTEDAMLDASDIVAGWLRLAGAPISAERAAELAAWLQHLEMTIWGMPVPEGTEPWAGTSRP